jgi:uncharacterized protein (DUF433 family)
MSETLRFTAAEAAFVLQEPVKNVKKALDDGPIRPILLQRAGSPIRAIDPSDLFYLYAVRTLREELTPKARGEFYAALKRQWHTRENEVQFGRFRVAISDLREEVEQRTQCLSELSDKIEFGSEGEVLLKGTKTEVYRIAALLDGEMPINIILADYPSLTREQVLAAKAYADAHPKPGRPYPAITAKQALRGAGLEALDEVLGGDEPSE